MDKTLEANVWYSGFGHLNLLTKRRLIDSLCSNLSVLGVSASGTLILDDGEERDETSASHASALKAYTFLLWWIFSKCDEEDRKALPTVSVSSGTARSQPLPSKTKICQKPFLVRVRSQRTWFSPASEPWWHDRMSQVHLRICHWIVSSCHLPLSCLIYLLQNCPVLSVFFGERDWTPLTWNELWLVLQEFKEEEGRWVTGSMGLG